VALEARPSRQGKPTIASAASWRGGLAWHWPPQHVARCVARVSGALRARVSEPIIGGSEFTYELCG
jgi:hypothetical protein